VPGVLANEYAIIGMGTFLGGLIGTVLWVLLLLWVQGRDD